MKLIKGRLKAARVQRELTLSDVEELTQGAVKISSLSSYERGLSNPGCEKIELLAKLYEVPMSYLCFCPYIGETRIPAAGTAGQGEDYLLDPDQAAAKVELTSGELEILRKILEKVKHHKPDIETFKSTA